MIISNLKANKKEEKKFGWQEFSYQHTSSGTKAISRWPYHFIWQNIEEAEKMLGVGIK